MYPTLLLAALPHVQDVPTTAPEIREEDYRLHLETLSSDVFEGRAPATDGGRRTVAYLIQQFQAAGLEPGYRGEWIQPVELVATTPTGAPSATITREGVTRNMVFGRDLMIVSAQPDGVVNVEESDVVFVGYGVVAPEYGWNDYEGLDVSGKTVLCLVNDPGYATQDPEIFRGNSMTYYGRYTYKYEEAARQGAAACLVIHEDGAAGYPWQVVNRSWGGTRYGLEPDPNEPVLPIEGWITEAAAIELIREAGGDAPAWFKDAASSEFRAESLGTSAAFSLENRSERSVSHNVVGVATGTERPEEAVLYCAHWDHLGRKPGGGADEIYNGAMDNASGTSGLLELAEAFGSAPAARSTYFAAFTAEESGLLGSKQFAAAPPVHAGQFVAGINMDGLNLYGPMHDVVVVGFGASDLDRLLADAASAQGRVLVAEPTPEKGYYYRSDHFNLAKVGIPMLYTSGGLTHRTLGAEYVADLEAEYLRRLYHQPSDEYDPEWDLSGAIEDLRLFRSIGLRLGNGGEWPAWTPGAEFEAIRTESLQDAAGDQ